VAVAQGREPDPGHAGSSPVANLLVKIQLVGLFMGSPAVADA